MMLLLSKELKFTIRLKITMIFWLIMLMLMELLFLVKIMISGGTIHVLLRFIKISAWIYEEKTMDKIQ